MIKLNLEQLIEKAKRLPLAADRPFFDVYTDYGKKQIYVRISDLELSNVNLDRKLVVFECQHMVYGHSTDNMAVFDLHNITPNHWPLPPLFPSAKQVYLVEVYSHFTSETEEKQSGIITTESGVYIIKGSFKDGKFRAAKAVEANLRTHHFNYDMERLTEFFGVKTLKKLGVYHPNAHGAEQLRVISKMPPREANNLMNLLRQSWVFPQNSKEETIAIDNWASQAGPLFLSNTPLGLYEDKMGAYAALLDGGKR